MSHTYEILFSDLRTSNHAWHYPDVAFIVSVAYFIFQPICNEADDTSPFSNSNEASYKQGHCNDTEQIFVAADGEVPQKTKEDKLLEPNAEKNIKECIVPSPL
jgi:hypothetical protein